MGKEGLRVKVDVRPVKLKMSSGKKLTLSGIVPQTIVDGQGLRMAVYAQGCPHNCKGCHNPETLPFEGGTEYTVEQILNMAAANPLLDGLTLSGGEPFCQAAAFGELAARARERGLNVWTYTGYTFEEITNYKLQITNSDMLFLLDNTDVLVDGRFVEARKSPLLCFRGSDNQRLIDVKKSLERGKVVEISQC